MTKPVSVAVGNRRLLKLADFLDKLPRQKFDFSLIAFQGEKPMLEALKAGAHRCGTVACAIGWMPAVFPRDVRWTDDPSYPEVCARKGAYIDNFALAEEYFAVSFEDARTLFDPAWSQLPYSATPKQVARHIRKFVKARQRAKAAA